MQVTLAIAAASLEASSEVSGANDSCLMTPWPAEPVRYFANCTRPLCVAELKPLVLHPSVGKSRNVCDTIGYAAGLAELMVLIPRSGGIVRPSAAAEVDARVGAMNEPALFFTSAK